MIIKSVAVLLNIILLVALFNQWFPFSYFMEWSAKIKATSKSTDRSFEFIEYDLEPQDSELSLQVILRHGAHFWYPQIAVWTENEYGELQNTLFITHSSAFNIFYGGRTRENYKQRERISEANARTINVNALPVWRGKSLKKQGSKSESFDGISGATPGKSFVVNQNVRSTGQKWVFIEVNVAFDENRFYSEFDYPDDSIYHSGTGLLGQPSVIYKAKVPGDNNRTVLFELIGHGHHSGKTDSIYTDMSSITTARNIIDFALVKMQ